MRNAIALTGPQVTANTCCTQSACSTFESKKAATEAVNCAQAAQNAAVRACYQRVRDSEAGQYVDRVFLRISRELEGAKSIEKIALLITEWDAAKVRLPARGTSTSTDEEKQIDSAAREEVRDAGLGPLRELVVSQLNAALEKKAPSTLAFAARVTRYWGPLLEMQLLIEAASPGQTATDVQERTALDSVMQRRISEAFRRVTGGHSVFPLVGPNSVAPDAGRVIENAPH